jgi:hypothetical protein
MPAAPTYELAAPTQTTTGSATSVTFSSISQAFTDLILVVTFGIGAQENCYVRFNGDTGSNYQGATYSSNNTTLAGNSYNNQAFLNPGWYTSVQANTMNGFLFCNIQSYSDTTTFTSTVSRAGSAFGTEHNIGIWKNTAAVSTILCYSSGSNFINGSVFSLYGIKAA